MIKANHKKWARFIYDRYFNYQLKNYFNAFYIVNEFPEIPENLALVITPNHMSWWDPFFIGYAYNFFTTKQHHVIMLENELKKYRFFTKVGAFSINPGDYESVSETLNYGIELLKEKDNLINLFPQGVLEPFDKRPLKLRSGALSRFSEECEFMILPVASRIHYYNERKPEIYMRFGKLIHSENISDDFNKFADEFNLNLESVNTSAYKREYLKEILYR